MKMFPALAFLPVGAIPEAFQDVLEVFPQEAMELADYFEDVYVGRPRRNGICSAQFPPKLWSVHESALHGMPRTNNSVEAWHFGLQSNVSCASPNFWVFLHCLKKEQALSEMKLSQAASGITATRVSRKQQTYNKRLQRILQHFDGTDNMVLAADGLHPSFEGVAVLASHIRELCFTRKRCNPPGWREDACTATQALAVSSYDSNFPPLPLLPSSSTPSPTSPDTRANRPAPHATVATDLALSTRDLPPESPDARRSLPPELL
ncbi:uncharacterized protein LOC144144157 [Haemaphysalis longicornis]